MKMFWNPLLTSEVRDFAPLLWKTGRTVRLYSRDLVWCSLSPKTEPDVQTFMKFIVSEGKGVRS
ncbi:MAG: hypothetical protein BWX92_03934 [Deltaproteobacteria bacterium ADurb.Bin135]|nr:MAG: hypothetical protein BWX92_03934 [Deltaproteobacteria bacterium ADurb.Bin135]